MPGSPGGGQAIGVGEAFNYGWSKFQQNLGTIILGVLALVAASVVIGVLWFFLVSATIGIGVNLGNAGAIAALFGIAVLVLVPIALNFIVQAQITRASLAITYGQTPDVRLLFATDGLPQVLLGTLILVVASFVGFLLCFLPGLLVVFFTVFFPHFVLDKRLSAVDAIKASVTLVNGNLATMVVFFLASGLAYAVGNLLCGVGFLVALPVVIIAQAYLYRRLQGEPVAA